MLPIRFDFFHFCEANGYHICKPSPSLLDRQCCGFGGLLSFSLSIKSVAWFCSVEIGSAMVVGLVWVFCVVGLWWSVVVLVYWVYDFFFGGGFTSGGGV